MFAALVLHLGRRDGRRPVRRREIENARDRPEEIAQIGPRLDAMHRAARQQRDEARVHLRTVLRSHEQPVLPPDRLAAEMHLRDVVVDRQPRVAEEAAERRLVVRRVADRVVEGRALERRLFVLAAPVDGEVRGRYAGCSTTSPAAMEQEYEFTGYETDALSGLQYAGARYYDPVLGTFLTHDPKRVTPNPYSYANWDPVNMVDPNGMEPFTIVGAIVVFAIGSAIGFTTAAIRAFMNGATWGEALKAGAISGAISGATAVVGAYLLQPAVSLAVAKLVSESATHLASALLFASSLAQAGYGISQNDYTGIIGLGLSVGVGWAFAQDPQSIEGHPVEISVSGNRVDITGTAELVGDPDKAREALRSLNKRWTGKFGAYDVHTNITEAVNGPGDIMISIDVSPELLDPPGPSYVDCLGCDVIHISPEADMSWAAHEFGHVLGLPDRYVALPGGLESMDMVGWIGNVMGGDPRGQVQERDVRSILNGR